MGTCSLLVAVRYLFASVRSPSWASVPLILFPPFDTAYVFLPEEGKWEKETRENNSCKMILRAWPRALGLQFDLLVLHEVQGLRWTSSIARSDIQILILVFLCNHESDFALTFIRKSDTVSSKSRSRSIILSKVASESFFCFEQSPMAWNASMTV